MGTQDFSAVDIESPAIQTNIDLAGQFSNAVHNVQPEPKNAPAPDGPGIQVAALAGKTDFRSTTAVATIGIRG